MQTGWTHIRHNKKLMVFLNEFFEREDKKQKNYSVGKEFKCYIFLSSQIWYCKPSLTLIKEMLWLSVGWVPQDLLLVQVVCKCKYFQQMTLVDNKLKCYIFFSLQYPNDNEPIVITQDLPKELTEILVILKPENESEPPTMAVKQILDINNGNVAYFVEDKSSSSFVPQTNESVSFTVESGSHAKVVVIQTENAKVDSMTVPFEVKDFFVLITRWIHPLCTIGFSHYKLIQSRWDCPFYIFKGSQVGITKLCIYIPDHCLTFANGTDPDKMPRFEIFNLGLTCFVQAPR